MERTSWELGKRIKDLEEVIRISALLADDSLGLSFRLQEALMAILKVAGARTGSIMLVERDELVVRAASNPRIINFRKYLRDSSVSTDVIRTGKRTFLRSPQEPRPSDGISRYSSDFSVSLPLFSRGMVIGVVNMTDKPGNQDFTLQEVEMLENCKRWFELVLENIWLKQTLEVKRSGE